MRNDPNAMPRRCFRFSLRFLCVEPSLLMSLPKGERKLERPFSLRANLCYAHNHEYEST